MKNSNTSLDDWATCALVAARLLGKASGSESQVHPAVLLQQVTGHVYAPRTPTERYFQERPSYVPRTPDDELLIPIDQVLGEYADRQRRITIYVHNTGNTARRLQCSDAALLLVVRVQ